MLTVLSVLRSGGAYNEEWVHRLKRAVERNLPVPHKFKCLSDVRIDGVNCIALQHDWPGWWAKIEIFRPGVVTGPTLYLDLDNVIVGDITPLTQCRHEFAMLRNFNRTGYASSCVMWFRERAPHGIYTKFKANPRGWIDYHEAHRDGPYIGDQAFISDCLGVQFIDVPKHGVASYRKNVQATGKLSEETFMVAFGGSLKPDTVGKHQWLDAAWA